MKAILEFDYEDASDRLAHKRAVSATDAYLALHELSSKLRTMRKYEHFDNIELTEGQLIIAEKFEEYFYKVLDEHGINLGDLE
jgi:hypothetical protein